MCCFSLPVRMVQSTRMFARPLRDGRQLLVYGMTLEISEDVAMILPIPVPAGSKEDAVRFVDMSACPKFFEHVGALFPATDRGQAKGLAPLARAPAPEAVLVVHDVGDFEA